MYTKGPWNINGRGKIIANGEVLRLDGVSLVMYQSDEAEANMSLVSAAPELLEALEEAADALAACKVNILAEKYYKICNKAKGEMK